MLERLAVIRKQIATLQAEALQIEQALISQVEHKYEGTSRGSGYKVKFKVTRSIDYDAYREVEDSIPEELRCVETKPVLRLPKYRTLLEQQPLLAAMFTTEKPAKPVVTINEEPDGN